MFEDILSNIKAHSAKLSESLTGLGNLRVQTTRFTDNFDTFKAQTTKLSENIFTALKNSSTRYLQVPQGDESEPLSLPADSNSQGKRELKWPVLVDNKMRWITFLPATGSIPNTDDDDEDIVERFIRVISVDEEKPVTQVRYVITSLSGMYCLINPGFTVGKED
jgi:hypothetical protein